MPGLRPLVLAERLVVHEHVHARLRHAGDPVAPLVRGERPPVPVPIRKPKAKVVGDAVVPRQQSEARRGGGRIDVVGRSPAKDLVGAFDQHRRVAESRYHRRQIVVVDQLRVAEHGRPLAEVTARCAARCCSTCVRNSCRIPKAAEAVMEGLAEELDAPGRYQLLEARERVRGVGLELVQQRRRSGSSRRGIGRRTGGWPRSAAGWPGR